MPLTPSNEIALGTQAPEFALPDAYGKRHALQDFAGAKALLVAFVSTHCPYFLHIRDPLAALARDYSERGLQIVAINSNDDVSHPEESVENIRAEIEARDYPYPYLKDASQDVAKAYGAACTPDLFLFDGKQRLFYHGQFDDSRPKNDIPATGADLRAAIDAALAGQPIPGVQKQAIGCNIKWQAGAEPAWFATA